MNTINVQESIDELISHIVLFEDEIKDIEMKIKIFTSSDAK